MPSLSSLDPPDSSSNDGYDPIFYNQLLEIEDDHFWFVIRNEIIEAVAGKILQTLRPGFRVLEIGSGTGNTLRVLDEVFEDGLVIGMDLFPEGLQIARNRTGRPLVQGDVRRHPFGARFDLICMFDVLEHLEDDVGVLQDVRQLLKPGGRLFLTVPAYMSLWSYFDVASHHQRRYQPSELEGKLKRCGYMIEYASPYMALAFPLVWLGRRMAAIRDSHATVDARRAYELAGQELRTRPGINTLMASLLRQEKRLITRTVRLPFGTSQLVIALNGFA